MLFTILLETILKIKILQNLLKIYFSIIEDRLENMLRICYDFGISKETIYYFL